MKLISVLLLALAAYVVPAAEVKKPTTHDTVVGPGNRIEEYYRAGEFNVSVYGGVTTPDFTKERTAVGASIGYFLTPRTGVEVEAFGGSLGGRLIDQAAAQLVYRIPVNRSAPYLFAGAYHHVDRKEFGVSVGLGIEHRFTEHIGIFTDARLEKLWASGDPAARARAGLRFAF